MTEKEKVNLPLKHLKIEPLTRRQIHETAMERVHFISKEFTDGFNFLQHYPKSVTIFGGTHFKESDGYYAQARSLGGRIAKDLGYSVLTGGGPGIMEAANRGAFENDGKSLGLTIELPNHQIQNEFLTNHLNFHYFFSRKVCMVFSAEAYIFFPGGFGTFDEFFELITLVQTGKIEKVPVVLVGVDFWTPFQEVMKNEMLSRGTIDDSDLKLYTITDNEDEIIEIIKSAPVRKSIVFKHGDEEELK
ncbi:MAG: TIGR00730 family Rossman fold protein [Nitrospira sp.]